VKWIVQPSTSVLSTHGKNSQRNKNQNNERRGIFNFCSELPHTDARENSPVNDEAFCIVNCKNIFFPRIIVYVSANYPSRGIKGLIA
jgi:hypothetical protein